MAVLSTTQAPLGNSGALLCTPRRRKSAREKRLRDLQQLTQQQDLDQLEQQLDEEDAHIEQRAQAAKLDDEWNAHCAFGPLTKEVA